MTRESAATVASGLGAHAGSTCACPGYPLEQIDRVRLNQIIRHRVRNVCGGCRMLLDVLRDRMADGRADAIDWDLLYREVEDVQRFSRRLDLLIEPLPPMQPLRLVDVLGQARDAFAGRFPLCGLELNGPEETMLLPAGNFYAIILDELLVNAGLAVQATPGDAVELAWEVSPSFQIVVANGGRAFPTEIPVNPPVPFRTTRPSCDGMGLAIVHRLCLALEVQMTVRTDLPGMTAVVVGRQAAEG